MKSEKPSKFWISFEKEFLVKRAFRFGHVQIKDMTEAFHQDSRAASRRFASMTEDSDEFSGLLIKDGKRLIPNPLAKAPFYADETDLVDSMLSYRPRISDDINGAASKHSPREENRSKMTFFRETGLRISEVPLFTADWLNVLPCSPGSLSVLVSSIIQGKAVEMCYVTLNSGDSIATGLQRLIPLSFQIIGGQISLFAKRISKFDGKKWHEKDDYRTYVLSRIHDVRGFELPRKLKGSAVCEASERYETLRLRFNPGLSKDQKNTLAHELCLRRNSGLGQRDEDVVSVSLPETKSYHFRQLYTNTPPSSSAVWPPLLLLRGES